MRAFLPAIHGLAAWALFAASPAAAGATGGRPHSASVIARLEPRPQPDSNYECVDFTIEQKLVRTIEKEYDYDNYDIDAFWSMKHFNILRTGTYNVSAVYCGPPAGEPQPDTVQLLGHGGTFNKKMWDSSFKPEKYNWQRRMNKEGYPTLAFDLIGAGLSDHPDGFFEVQAQTFVEQLRDGISMLRSGEISGKPFKNVALIGFSITAITALSLLQQVPNAVDALALQGFTYPQVDTYPAFLAGQQVTGNSLPNPAWKNLDNFYTTQPTRRTRLLGDWSGDYEEGALDTDFAQRDLVTLGVAVTFKYHVVDVPSYTGPVFLGNGDQDGEMCGQSCGSKPYAIYDHMPNASDYDIKVYPRSGHVISFHSCAPQLMNDTLEFFKRNGL